MLCVGGKGLVVHGGCGVIVRGEVEFSAREKECRGALREALRVGWGVLEGGGSAVDAVAEAIVVLEDCPGFNAGKGAVFTRDGTNELDAGIMDGHTGSVGGVSTLTTVKNPIRLAVEVMRETPHAVLCGEGAERWGKERGVDMVSNDYFFTHTRHSQLLATLHAGNTPQLDHDVSHSTDVGGVGTVGAVALDGNGRLATGSSTGGLTGKYSGRVSDSSIPGAGFYANSSMAVSATGKGDAFIATSLCKQIADIMEYRGLSLEEATTEAIQGMGNTSSGVIGIDHKGCVSLPYNTPGMFRGAVGTAFEEPYIAIWDK